MLSSGVFLDFLNPPETTLGAINPIFHTESQCRKNRNGSRPNIDNRSESRPFKKPKNDPGEANQADASDQICCLIVERLPRRS